MKPGEVKFCVAGGVFKLVHNSTTLILPGGGDLTTASGDSFAVVCLSSGKYRVLFYTQGGTASNGFSTGDVKLTLKTVADSGWVLANDGTIGNSSSSATTRANEDCRALYLLLWTNVSDTYAPVTGGRGGSATADFDAGKKLALTKMLGRVLGIAGSGSSLTARTLGQTLGEETHLQTTAELATHNHGITDPGHGHIFPVGAGAGGDSRAPLTPGQATGYEAAVSTVTSIAINNTGSSTPFNVMQPTSFINVMIKL
jgi:microcystin-dependent protein